VKRILVVALSLVMIISFAACQGEKISSEEIVDRVIEAQKSIKTARSDINMTMDMAGEAEDESYEATMVMDMSYILDVDGRKVASDVTMSIDVLGEEEMDMATKTYIIDDMMYMMMDAPEMEPMWMKSEMPEGIWDSINQIESQVELLRTAQVKVIGSEKVRGVDCYVVELTPDAEQLWQLFMQQLGLRFGGAGQGMIPEVAEDVLKEIFRSFSVKQWISKDTFFLTKMEMDMTMHLTPEAMGYPDEEGEVAMNITMDMLAYDYNKSVSIVLPPEAEDAVEMSMP